MPISEKQLAANRANAKKSTGPRTAEGKARSAQNALKHGLCSATYSILRMESGGELDELQAAAFDFYQPVNAQEVFAVERIALAQLVILRAYRLEAGHLISALNSGLGDSYSTPFFALNPILSETKEEIVQQNRNYALADGLERTHKGGLPFVMLLRYQAQADRLYRRAVEDFERLKKLRPESPNEAIYTFEPPPPEPYRPPQPAERCEAEGTTLTPDPRPLIPFPPDTIKSFPHTDHP